MKVPNQSEISLPVRGADTGTHGNANYEKQQSLRRKIFAKAWEQNDQWIVCCDYLDNFLTVVTTDLGTLRYHAEFSNVETVAGIAVASAKRTLKIVKPLKVKRLYSISLIAID